MKRHLKENAFCSIFDAAKDTDKSLNLWVHQQQITWCGDSVGAIYKPTEYIDRDVSLPKIEVKAASFSNRVRDNSATNPR